jgi:hypothetical protein
VGRRGFSRRPAAETRPLHRERMVGLFRDDPISIGC